MQILQNVGVKLSEILRTFMETSPPPMHVPLLLSLFIVVVLLLVVLCQRDSLPPKKKPKSLAKNSDTSTRQSGENKDVPKTSVSFNVSNSHIDGSANENSQLNELQELLLQKLNEMDETKTSWKDITDSVPLAMENDVIRETIVNGKSLFKFQRRLRSSAEDVAKYLWERDKKIGKTVKSFKILNVVPNEQRSSAYRVYHKVFPGFGNQVITLSERDLICAEALFDLGDGRIAHVAKSIPEIPSFASQLGGGGKAGGPVRADLEFSVCILEDLGENLCSVTRYVNMDYKLPWWIPTSTLRKEQTSRPLKSLAWMEKCIISEGFCKLVTLPEKHHVQINTSTFQEKGLPATRDISGKNKRRNRRNKSRNETVKDITDALDEIAKDAENVEMNMYISLGLAALTCFVYVLRRR